mmetsp:Transcript_122728/g.274086  ORF Transcript_122728/g.274086 Transcript_122728/m.274086 type:complete len:257 (-) Transcript_122728:336-1106(-)
MRRISCIASRSRLVALTVAAAGAAGAWGATRKRAHSSALPRRGPPEAAQETRNSARGCLRRSSKRSQSAWRSAFSKQPARFTLLASNNAFNSLVLLSTAAAMPAGLGGAFVEAPPLDGGASTEASAAECSLLVRGGKTVGRVPMDFLFAARPMAPTAWRSTPEEGPIVCGLLFSLLTGAFRLPRLGPCAFEAALAAAVAAAVEGAVGGGADVEGLVGGGAAVEGTVGGAEATEGVVEGASAAAGNCRVAFHLSRAS